MENKDKPSPDKTKVYNGIHAKPASVMLGEMVIKECSNPKEAKEWLKNNSGTLETGRYTVAIPEAYVCEIVNEIKRKVNFN